MSKMRMMEDIIFILLLICVPHFFLISLASMMPLSKLYERGGY